jgi:hypothetical protein
MTLADLYQLDADLDSEISEMEGAIIKKKFNRDFVKELIEKEKAKAGLTSEPFYLNRAAMEARNVLEVFSKRDLESTIQSLYPEAEFNVKSLDRIVGEWLKHNHVKLEREAEGKIGALYRNLNFNRTTEEVKLW